MSKKSMEYNSDSIDVLEGLEAVRVRPGMYIGDTSSKGLHHLLWEIVDNGIDEIANGYGDTIDIEIFSDNSIVVTDNGRGIPVDLHKKLKIPALEIVFTKLHAGAKFGGDESYNFSGGLHGVGAAVTNALSKWLTVTSYKNGIAYTIDFHSIKIDGKMHSGIVKNAMREEKCDKKLKGTRVHFLPDDEVFKGCKINFETVNKHIRELAFLNKKLKIKLKDNRERDDIGLPKSVEYCYEGGLVDFVKYLNEDKKVTYKDPIYFERESEGLLLSVAMQHTDDSESICSYVNNIPTTEGGVHETGIKAGLTKAFNEFARANNLIKEKDSNFAGEDFRDGLTIVFLLKMRDPEFEGQTKAKLSNSYIRTPIEQMTVSGLTEALGGMTKATVSLIMEKALQAKKERERLQNSKDMSKRMREINSNNLVGKLSSCIGRNAKKNELFIVEGDSAGGTAKQGRDRNFQAILPLRGKPLNVAKAKLDKALDNEEIGTIISALGAGFYKNFDVTNIKYDKVIILADADQDGAHIRAILLTFFYRYMRPLVTEGHVYIGMPPLYKIENKGVSQYVYDDEKLKEALGSMTGKRNIQRYKGLGEMNPEQLWETTMDPEKRLLLKVTLDDVAAAEKMISTLMGDNAEARKEYINTYANFNKIDMFEEIGG